MVTEQPSNPKPHIPRLILISVGIGLLGGFILIGLPGALLLELLNLAYPIFGLSPLVLTGDSVWPVSIMISLLWPVTITPLYILHHQHFPTQSLLTRWLFSLSGGIFIAVITVFMWFM